MDHLDGGFGRFKSLRKDDFEADWIKVSESSLGAVYRVKLKVLRETCALKCFDTTLSGNNVYRRMTDEVSKLAKVKFRYVVSIYGVCSDPVGVVMEFMNGGSLNSLLASHTLTWPKKFHMIHEVTMGMNYLHSLAPPLLHLNLKPTNILLDDHLHVKIADFGLIKWEEAANQKELVEQLTERGNVSYIPPEAYSPSPSPPGTTFDVYSFSIVMWEILTQSKPYPGSSITTVLMKVSSGRRPSLEMIPDNKPPESDLLISIMQQCWDQEHWNRPEFSETVRKTELLSEVLRLPGTSVGGSHGDQPHTPDYSLLCTSQRKSIHNAPDSASGDDQDSDGVLFFLSQRDFQSFRRSLKKEHLSLRYSDNNSLLHYAVASGDIESVRLVLAHGAQTNCPSKRGYTPLIVSILHRLHDISTLLVESKADVNLGDSEDWTPLHFAAQNGDDRDVRLLLDKGARPGSKEQTGWTPLHLAIQNGHESVVRLLLSRLDSASEGEGPQGRTPLHLASAYGHVSIAKLLLSQGADPNAVDQSQSTSLHLAAEAGHFRVARLLIKEGSEVNLKDRRHYTPLHVSALKGHAGICRQLLAQGAMPDARTLQGWTPMHLAALKGHGACLLLLESHQASVDVCGEGGWTPLLLACHHTHEDATSKLLAAHACPHLADDRGWTPLHLACHSGSFPSVLQLISHGALVNARNGAQATPLHLAAQRGYGAVVRALLLNGADRRLGDASGCTALELARRSGREEVIQILEEEE
ncbi:ankyrin repeat and protein kinase domain-containing protein 1 [Osmerus eperlanus]|uniref:ankyrin repeat and protein kinase domain-containing protein 1 n=1 Tax=Osmerus eperlanus TaxID=29151 RepID=UPI002E14ACAC